MEKKIKQKRITVGSIFQPRQNVYGVNAPYIRLVGFWLKEAGFDTGAIMDVEVHPGCIILKKTPYQWEYKQHTKRVLKDAE